MFRLLYFVPLFVGLSCAPHKHHHHISKTIYVGSDGEAAGHANLGASAGISLGGSATLGGAADGVIIQKHEVVSEKLIDVEAPLEPELKAHKTVIERTYVPQYAEKTVKVPTYVEKTIRVPTYVEKTVKVPIEPKVVEKEVSREHVEVPAVKVKEVGYHGGHYGGGGLGIAAHGHSHGTGFFDGIFNIPVQTLGAVNGFLNGLAGGGFHAHAGVSKGFSVY